MAGKINFRPAIKASPSGPVPPPAKPTKPGDGGMNSGFVPPAPKPTKPTDPARPGK